jgi:hypothetical protein
MQEKCVACGVQSPNVDSQATLTGEHGWRPIRHEGSPQGAVEDAEIEWRCPPCWQEYRDNAAPTTAWCAGCGGVMPSSSPIDTSWTRYGWRASRRSIGEGRRVVEFFCPACWRRKAAAR